MSVVQPVESIYIQVLWLLNVYFASMDFKNPISRIQDSLFNNKLIMAGIIAWFVECFSGTRSPGFDPWCCIKLSLVVHTVIPAPGRQPLGDPVVRYPWLYDELWPLCFKYQTHVLIGVIIIKMYRVWHTFYQTSYQCVHLFGHFSALSPHTAGASQTLCHHFVVLVPDFLKYTTNCHTPQLPSCALSIRSQSSLKRLKAAHALSPLCAHPPTLKFLCRQVTGVFHALRPSLLLSYSCGYS